jgi:hypothetical protein
MALLSNPLKEVLAQLKPEHFGSVMQEIWDEAQKYPGSRVIAADAPLSLKPFRFELRSEFDEPLKAWVFSVARARALIEAIPNGAERDLVRAHMSHSFGREAVAMAMSPGSPRPEPLDA